MDDIRACRACLEVGTKLLSLDINMVQYYMDMIRNDDNDEDKKPHYLCFECFGLFHKYKEFKDKCARSDMILTGLLMTNVQISTEYIKKIDRTIYKLQSNLVLSQPTFLEYDPCNENCGQVNIKEESKDEETPSYDIEINTKREEISKIKESGDHCDTNDGLENSFEDSDDDIPLNQICRAKDAQRSTLNKKSVKTSKRVPKSKWARMRESNPMKLGVISKYASEMYMTREQQLEDMRKRSVSLNYLNSPYKCNLCFKGFLEKAAFAKHNTKHTKEWGDYECDICHLRFKIHYRLKYHTANSHSRYFKCKHCSHVTHTANQAREHELWHRGYKYECKMCDMKFEKPTSLITHLRKNHETEFICELCGDSFVGRHGLLLHKSKTHMIKHDDNVQLARNLESYCAECDFQFVSVDAWRTHIITSVKHLNEKVKSCKICKKQFGEFESLKDHMKKHLKKQKDPDKPHVDYVKLPCNQCDAKYISQSQLQAHIKRKHMGWKYCKDSFCEVCGKRFNSNATLKNHQRIHTGEKPFACTECPKKFVDKWQLRVHTRTHTNEKPYSCNVCSQKFGQKPSLNRHMRVHTGAKPYVCQYCSKTFNQSSSMKLHVRTIHLKIPYNRRKKCSNKDQIDIKTLLENPAIDGSDVTLQTL